MPPVLDEFIASWASILWRWRSERGMSCPFYDLQHLIRQLDGWFDNHDLSRTFKAEPSKPTTAQPVKPVEKLAEKEANWGTGGVLARRARAGQTFPTHRDATMGSP